MFSYLFFFIIFMLLLICMICTPVRGRLNRNSIRTPRARLLKSVHSVNINC